MDRPDKWEKFWKSERKSSLPEKLFQENYKKDDCAEESCDYTKSLTKNAVQRNWMTPSQFVCCPKEISNTPLDDYLSNLHNGKIFCKHQYGQLEIIKFSLSKDNNSIIIRCFNKERNIKSFYVAKITFENNLFVHTSVGSYFTDEGAEKYYTLALGEEWSGSDVLDDYCS